MSLSSLKSQFLRLVGTNQRDILVAEAVALDNAISTEARTETHGLGGNDEITGTAIAGTLDDYFWDGNYREEPVLSASASNAVDAGGGVNFVTAEAQARVKQAGAVSAANDIQSGSGRADIAAWAEAHGFVSGEGAGFRAENSIRTGLSNDVISATALTSEPDTDSGADAESKNVISSGSGHDFIFAHAESRHGYDRFAFNEIDSGTGDDVIEAIARVGDSFAGDPQQVAEARNVINARAGNDHVTAEAVGLSATNWISAGAGDDTVYALADVWQFRSTGPAKNTVLAGAGDDFVHARVFASTTETIRTWGENDLQGGDGHDMLIGEITGEGLNRLSGGNGNDVLTASLRVENGRLLPGAEGTNHLTGGAGDDQLFSYVRAGAEGAFITAILDGGDGDDWLSASYDYWTDGFFVAPASVTQTLRGGAGDDRLDAALFEGVVGRSELYGGQGDDVLTVWEGQGNILDGGEGDDILYAGNGDDLLIGGAGADTFVFDLPLYHDPAGDPYGGGLDTIADFSSGADRLGFIGIEDTGAAGLADDLDAISLIEDLGPGGDVIATFSPGSAIIFAGLGTGVVTSFADLVDDPASQLIVWDALV